MIPVLHTVYTISLFLALDSLLLWSNRRHRAEPQQPARVNADKSRQ